MFSFQKNIKQQKIKKCSSDALLLTKNIDNHFQ